MSAETPSDVVDARRWGLRARRAAVVLALAAMALSGVSGGGVRRSFLARRTIRHDPAAGYSCYVMGDPADVVRLTRPGLVLEGGGTDIDESFRWMIGRSGGGDFVVIRTTGRDAYNSYIYNLAAPCGARPDSVTTLVIASKAAASHPFVVSTVRNAEALWIAGGDQSKHVAWWHGTPVAAAVDELAARGVPVGGTSSGLAVMGQYVYSAEADLPKAERLLSSEVLRDPFHPRVTLRRDVLRLPLLRDALLEPHFLQESRHGRMATFLARIAAGGGGGGREVRGLGIDRATALLVEADGRARVITGPGHPFGRATFFRMTVPAKVCRPGEPLTVGGIAIAEFGPGATLDLKDWGSRGGAGYLLSVDAGSPRMRRIVR